MRKARVKRYQTGGKVDDDDEPLVANAGQASSNPLRAVPTVARATPSVKQVQARPQQGNTMPFPGRSLPSVNPATQIKSSTPVGGNVAVGGGVRNPTIDPMANAKALDVGARRDATTGFGTGATNVENTKSYMEANPAPSSPSTTGFNLPSGGFAAVGAPKARPVAPSQPTGKATLAANLPRFPQGQVVAGIGSEGRGFVYGGRVDMTPPGNVGFKRPGPFRSGGRVPAFRHGGRVKKMQSGGSIFSPEHEDQGASMSDQKTAGQVRMTPQDLAARQRENNQSNETARAKVMNDKPRPVMRHGGKVRKMQDGGSVMDALNESPETAFLSTPRPTPTPTPTPRPPATTSGPRFIDKVKGIADAVARSDPDNFQDGGMVSGIARNTPGETQVQTTIHAPARHQFKIGGRIYQRGGQIPGKPTGKDTVPAMLSPGEVVLNPKQQKRVVVRPNWQKGLNPKEKNAMASMRLPRARNQRAITGNSVPRIFGGK